MSSPVAIMVQRRASLPASGEFVGQLVVLSGTGVIYRWQGASWVADGSGGGGGVSDGTYGDITVTSSGTVWTIGAAKVTLAKMANLATARFIGRVTGSTGVPEAMTGTQATSLLDVFTDALKGLVPASGGGTTNFLRADGTWAPPSASATNVEVDFGSTPVTEATFVVTDAAVSGTSKILVSESGTAATGRAAGDALWDSISCAAVPGSGSFTLYCKANPGPVVDKRTLSYMVL